MSEEHADAAPAEPTSTQLRDYYEALLALKEEEQTVLAEAHAADPTLLIHRFAESVKKAELRVGQAEESFHEREALAPAADGAEIVSTIDFARQLVGRDRLVADPHGDLSFAYVDREIFPGRTKGVARMRKRTADLLLVNLADRLPIVGELKIGSDRPTYFAFVQALMHAAELVGESQRRRLAREYDEVGFRWPDAGPLIDVYVIGFEPPQRGEFRERSGEATERIAEKMMSSPKVTRWLRRVAYLEASSKDGELEFEAAFVFDRVPRRAPGQLIGVAPKRLANAPSRSLPKAVTGARYESVATTALDWQATSTHARFWEMGTAGASGEGRVYALANQIAAAGEQLALSLAAAVEVAIWREAWVGKTEVDPTEAMQMRAMAEAQSLFVLGAGHALANLAVRTLALDENCRAQLGHRFPHKGKAPTFDPFSTQRSDWVSFNRYSCKQLREVARATTQQEVIDLIEPVAALGTGDAWRRLEDRRGQDFHRWRPQTPGLGGGPAQTPWIKEGNTRRLDLVGPAEDISGLVDEVADLATAGMFALAEAMAEFRERWPAASKQLGGPQFRLS